MVVDRASIWGQEFTRDEINQILWNACDTFRGTVDPAEYKNCILVMLFVKYISDVWRDHYEAYLEKYSGDEDRAKRAMRGERLQPEHLALRGHFRARARHRCNKKA